MPRSQKSYIRFKFPPAYLLWILPKGLQPSLSPEETYSLKDIQALLRMKQCILDLPRTSWILGKNNKPSWFGSELRGPESTIEDMQANFKSYDLDFMRSKLRIVKHIYLGLGENNALQYQFCNSQGEIITRTLEEPVLKTYFGSEYIQFKNVLAALKNKNLNDQSKMTALMPFREKLLKIIEGKGDIRLKADNNDLTLTKEEASALCAFAFSAGKNDPLQGGFFRFPENSFLVLFFASLKEKLHSANIDTESFIQVTRENQNTLNILYQFKYCTTEKIPKNLFICSHRYKLQQKGRNFTLRRMNNIEDCTVLIDKKFFYRLILPYVLEELNTANESDLKKFIPWLAYKPFAKAFFRKLDNISLSTEAFNTFFAGISLCFSEELAFFSSFWNRNQAKISLIIANFLLLATIFVPILMTFGLPVVVGAFGGVFIFSIMAALAVAFSAISGLFVGNHIDKQRTLLVDSLEKMKQLHAESFKDEPASIELQNIASSRFHNVPEEVFKKADKVNEKEKDVAPSRPSLQCLFKVSQNMHRIQ